MSLILATSKSYFAEYPVEASETFISTGKNSGMSPIFPEIAGSRSSVMLPKTSPTAPILKVQLSVDMKWNISPPLRGIVFGPSLKKGWPNPRMRSPCRTVTVPMAAARRSPLIRGEPSTEPGFRSLIPGEPAAPAAPPPETGVMLRDSNKSDRSDAPAPSMPEVATGVAMGARSTPPARSGPELLAGPPAPSSLLISFRAAVVSSPLRFRKLNGAAERPLSCALPAEPLASGISQSSNMCSIG